MAEQGSTVPPSPHRHISPSGLAVVGQLVAQAQELGDPEKNLPSEILDGFLFLGDAENARHGRQLQNLGITHVINTTTDSDLGAQDLQLARICLNVEDSEKVQIASKFDEACDFIKGARDQPGAKVLVHCMAGASRSATIVLAYLMRQEKMPLADAYWHVQKRRHMAHPNRGFWKQLAEEEQRLFGVSSPTPSCYQEDALTAAELFTRFLGGDEQHRQKVVEEWPRGLAGAASVSEIIRASIDDSAPAVGVEFVQGLVLGGRVARADAHEGFRSYVGCLDEECLDDPQARQHMASVRQAAAQYAGLWPDGLEV